MQAIHIPRAGFLCLTLFAFASCTQSSGTGPVSFQSQYVTARDALEKGDFDQANRMYLKLASESGALQPRMLLELSHSYLRAGDFAAAAAEASRLAQSQSGTGRAAALAVEATARHELGTAALARGDATKGRTQLEQAAKALSEVLAQNPEFDPMGGLAGRQKIIATRLKELR